MAFKKGNKLACKVNKQTLEERRAIMREYSKEYRNKNPYNAEKRRKYYLLNKKREFHKILNGG